MSHNDRGQRHLLLSCGFTFWSSSVAVCTVHWEVDCPSLQTAVVEALCAFINRLRGYFTRAMEQVQLFDNLASVPFCLILDQVVIILPKLVILDPLNLYNLALRESVVEHLQHFLPFRGSCLKLYNFKFGLSLLVSLHIQKLSSGCWFLWLDSIPQSCYLWWYSLKRIVSDWATLLNSLQSCEIRPLAWLAYAFRLMLDSIAVLWWRRSLACWPSPCTEASRLRSLLICFAQTISKGHCCGPKLLGASHLTQYCCLLWFCTLC